MRTDIQALRAVAVLYVLLNHLWPNHLPGGFAGVDVFFVISGYLITAHLVREQDVNGRIALGAFWARRARRLLPAALLVLLTSALLVVVFIPQAARLDDLSQIGWATLYVLNWALAGQSLDYFAQEAGQTVVTHFWSLSVEEQFYIVWPVILVGVFLAFRGSNRRSRHIALGWAMTLVLLASFAWAVYSVRERPEAAYFETTSRAWEFAVGGLLALAPVVIDKWRRRLVPLVWLGWGGLAASAFVLSGSSGVPGFAALLPVVSTATIIAIGQVKDQAWSPSDVVGWRPVQALGDISYSAYLWHFPLIVLAPYALGHDLRTAEKLIILIGTLGLAAVTKRFVEDPVRFGALARLRPAAVLAGTLTAMVVVGGGTLGAAAAVQARADAVHDELMAQAQAGGDCFGAQAVLSGAECAASHVLADPTYLEEAPTDTFAGAGGDTESFECVPEPIGGVEDANRCVGGVSDGAQSLNVTVFGDSHMAMWRAAIRNLSDDYDMRITSHMLGGCAPSADQEIFATAGADRDQCWNWRSTLIDQIADDERVDVVITTSRANTYKTADGQRDTGTGYVDAWEKWLDAGKTVIVIEDVPSLAEPLVDCVLEVGWDTVDPCTRELPENGTQTALGRAAEQIDDPRFHFVDYSRVFCDDSCHAIIGSIPAYQDANHLSVAFAMSFGSELLRDELTAASTAP